MFADTDVVMVPRVAVEYATFDFYDRFRPLPGSEFRARGPNGLLDAYRKKSRVPRPAKPGRRSEPE
jgi:hypothetical protein